MRCSSCEPQLSAYVDGELGPVARARVARHLATCDGCATTVDELRSIDALMRSPRSVGLAPNFSFVVMADVRALPAPQRHRGRPFAVLATYVVFAWSAIGAYLVFGGGNARAALAAVATTSGRLSAVAAALARATAGLFGHHTFDVTAAMGGLLALDLVAASALVAAYALRRTRRSHRLDEASW
ncbi:MAG: hypothetical protein NVSMB21_17850 [Vulcanimicrobiaceae bacterium]